VIHLDPERSPVWQKDAIGELAIHAQGIQDPRNNPRVPPDFILSSLLIIYFFDHCKRDDNAVFFKNEKGFGIMQQDIRIQNVSLWHLVDLLLLSSSGWPYSFARG
jgi:hypothetical protein